MRPVLLEMNGFASFREPTLVDFREAEYFALVGPTGSGKSTVIDALTFALYGSVPRWDNARTVSLALAPTAGRGAVRFVFDVGGGADAPRGRYVVARELRRAASGSVTVRSARLERLRDRDGTGAPEEETTPLADGAPAVTKAVEELLGLPFGDFTTCVVLPQGEFAEFLHTEPRKRQEKLVRILGLGVYDVIAREANSEAARQRQRAEVLGEQLGAYGDATEEAEQAAAARVGELEALAERVAAAIPELAAATTALADAQELAARLDAECGRLAAVTVPAGASDLDARQRAAGADVAAAAGSAREAEVLDTMARERLAAAPARGPLEQVRRDHAERAVLAGELPGVQERHEKARHADDTATRAAATAREAVDAARALRDTAAGALGEARGTALRLGSERAALRAVAVPAGLDVLDRRRSAAADALERATAALAEAETAETGAREALAAAPARGHLEQAQRDHVALAVAQDEHRSAVERRAAAEVTLAGGAVAAVAAREHLGHAQARRAEGLRADLAAALRPALEAGHACPVCAQEVATLPAPLPATDLDAMERAVADAEAAYEQARRVEAEASAAQVRAAGELERCTATIRRLEEALAAVEADVAAASGRPGGTAGRAQGALFPVGAADDDGAARPAHAEIPSAPAVDAALAVLDAVAAAVEEAGTRLRTARQEREGAATTAEAVRDEATAASAALRAARDPLVPLGAPAVEDVDGDVLGAWRAFVGWAGAEATARDDALPAAEAAVEAAHDAQRTAEQALADAERTAQERRRDETATARAEQDAGGALTRIQDRLTVLRAALEGALTDTEAERELAGLAELEAAARTADAGLRAARAAQRAAESAAAATGREAATAWDALRAARDPLVPLGAPAVAGEELLAAWTALADWAGREAESRRARLADAGAAAGAARTVRDGLERRVLDDLAAHDVTAPGTGAAPAAVAAAAERARAARERIAERRAAAGTIAADRDAAESAQQVAKLLGNLLRSDGFPRWLVASALDTLVADASRSLAELSGGQFELTHDSGEFLVVDHADADARRPVKTLSGGETFQASLALALALSSQMSGLAARGAARLESIFLDEGFGTLDEANLDVVAGTLENLATRGDRVVGVITHVPALAERVPVRFAVSRDQRTSSVVREGA
jgi:DNA repair protein SbcC/Rad50